MFDILIKNTHLVTCEKVKFGSLAIKDGKIADILLGNCEVDSKITIDGTGKYLFPGLIDAHAHLNEPGFTTREDFYHGTRAAAVGGVTTVIDMPMQNEPALYSKDIFVSKEACVSSKAYVDYSFYGALVTYNLNKLEELNSCGVVAFKSFFAPVSPDYTPLNTGQIRHALSIIKKFDGLASFHCEDYNIITYEQNKAINEGRLGRRDFLNSRPVIAELMAVKNIIELAKEQNCRVHICHVSHPAVAEEIKKAKMNDVKITAETCPHYLIFDENDFLTKGAIFKCAPPLRTREDKKKLLDYVCDGTIDIIVSDHSPCAPEEKLEDMGIFNAWGGISGIQTGLQTMYDYLVAQKGISPSLVSKVMSANPAKHFEISSKKGSLSIGADADVVLLDPNKNWKITSNNLEYLNKQSAFVGLEGKGLPILTILRGKIISANGHITEKTPYGHLIKRNLRNFS
ncbi:MULTISPECIES: allantoinase AllB [unclassified Clostridium]|uniref:allantoinase AllB n=1 Tax=unclassified Clostridium TaxID=2614128 RepID=UPI000298499A|nr:MULTISPECIES: allantoinase AllB [unclassified Clostridium]EKQ55475.1 MAG: allantoinase [Clostridium sp. Maddingley MBC34-26]